MLFRLVSLMTCSTPSLSVNADARVDIGAITMSGTVSTVKPHGQRKASEPPNSHTQVPSCVKLSKGLFAEHMVEHAEREAHSAEDNGDDKTGSKAQT